MLEFRPENRSELGAQNRKNNTDNYVVFITFMSWNFLFLLVFLLCAWCWLDWAKKALILAEVSSLVLGFELISRSRWRYTPPGVLRLSLFLIIIPPPDSMCRVRFKRKFRRFQNAIFVLYSLLKGSGFGVFLIILRPSQGNLVSKSQNNTIDVCICELL